MCKKSLLFVLLFALLAPWAANAQSELTVYEGTVTSNVVPAYIFYFDDFTRAQHVIPAEDLADMNGATITSLKYYTTAYNVPYTAVSPAQVYLMEVDYTTMTALEPLGSGTVVFEGYFNVVSEGTGGSLTIEFDTPYTYNGGNLLVGIDNTEDVNYKSINFYGQTVTGASWAGSNGDDLENVTGSQRDFIPQTTFTYIPAGATICEKPETLEVTDITGFGATCTWTSEVGNYTFEWKKASATEWNVVPNLTTTTYELDNLEPYTVYDVRVKAICGTDFESAYKSASFTTLDVCPEGMVCIGEGTATNSNLPTNCFYNYSYTQQIYTAEEIGEAATILSVDFYSVSATTRDLEIYMVSTDKDSFESTSDWISVTENDLVFSGEVTFAASSWNTFELDNGFNYDGTHNVALIVRDMTGSYDNSYYFFVFEATAQALYARRDGSAYDITAPGTANGVLNVKNRVRFGMGEPPACPKPTLLTVNYEGDTEATITWSSEATSFNISVNGEVIEDVTSPYILEDLELSTDYEVMVQANCGDDGMSEWTNPVTFTTDDCMLADMTIFNYTLTDSYGDGWNGNYILLLDETCTIVDALTIESGSSASGSGKICGSFVQFVWYMANSNTYPSETSWVFTDANGNVLFSGAGNTSMQTADILYTIDNNPVKAPTNLDVTEIGPHSAKLSWTENGTATAWQIMIDEDEENIIDANSNPFVVTGLDPETEYFMQVRAVSGNETSNWTCVGVDFYTAEPCPEPSDLSVTPYPYTANVTWNGWGESYDIEWAEMTEYEPTADALWLQYDDDTYATSIGSSSGGTWTWGVMYTPDMFNGLTYLNKVSNFETTYYTGDYTISIYTGGDDAPETLVSTETVTLTGDNDWHEIQLSAPVTIDPTQNLWIVVTATGTYVLTSCETTEPNNQWVLNGSTWANIGNLSSSLAGYGWMIRGLLDNVTPDYVWNTEANVSSPYTITDLNPESEYVVRVKASCGDDGESHWATTTFTTPSPCDVAIDLTAEAEATSANLSWTGYQDSYNLRYWSPGHMLEFDATDFTQVGEDIMADSVLTTYNFDLSAFSGVGNVAIRHYNVTDMFRLNVDDIVVTNAQGEVVVSEDFESGEINLNWINYDNDGDGYVWDIWPITQLDADSMPVGNGDYCATSASYNSTGALFPDNWLIIPNVELGGTLTFVARGQDPSWSDEIFGVFVSTNELYVPGTDPVTVEGVTNPYTLTGLNPETPYAFQVQGVNAECDAIGWSEIAYFTTTEQTTLTQTIALAAGTNWFSTNVEITLADLQAALVEALPGTTGMKIATKTQNTTYNGSSWRGSLRALDVAYMYKITVPASCEITLEGMPINPAEHPITIPAGGAVWIGFPFSENMTPANAFAGFAVNGDKVSSKDNSSTYTGRWRGNLNNLEPGKGYIYKSAATESRTLVFPSASKAAKNVTFSMPTTSNHYFGMSKRASSTMDTNLDVDVKPAAVPQKKLQDLIKKEANFNIKK